MNKSVLAVMLVLSLITGQVDAEHDFSTGEYFLNACKGNDGDFGSGFCQGVIDALFALDIAYQRVCTPGDLTTAEYRGIIIEHMENNPLDLHQYYVASVINAARETFPCSE
jgi:hypothetical protein